MITIIFEDEEYSVYYKTTAGTFTQAEMELDRMERNYNKEIARQKEELKDDHIKLEVMEQEEELEKEKS